MKMKEFEDVLSKKYGISINCRYVKERLKKEFGIVDFENIPDNVVNRFDGIRVSLGKYGDINGRSRTTILMYKDKFESYRKEDNKLLDIENYWTMNVRELSSAFDRIINNDQYARLRKEIVEKAKQENVGMEKTIFNALKEYVSK